MIANIIISSLCLLLYTYSDAYCKKDPSTELECRTTFESEIYRDLILGQIFIFFNSIFLTEMFLKIIARGFILHKKSYLRNGWNCLDFIINIYSILEIIYPQENYALRVSRLVRILKAINIFRGIKRLFISIIMSLPILGNVLLFLGFVFIVFATLGTQLFSGSLYNRCRKSPDIVYRNDTFFYYSPPQFNRVCTIGNGYFSCPEGYDCVNFYNLSRFYNTSDVFQFDVSDEGIEFSSELFFGIANYDNIFISMINVLGIMTYQDWSLQFNIYLDSNSPVAVKIFFFIIVTIGGFFIMRLILAAQNEAFVKFRLDEKREKLNFILKLEKSYPKIFEKISKEEMLRKLEHIDPDVLYKNIRDMNLDKLMAKDLDELPVTNQLKLFQNENNISSHRSHSLSKSSSSVVSSSDLSPNMSPANKRISNNDGSPSQIRLNKDAENDVNLNFLNKAANNHWKMRRLATKTFEKNTSNIFIVEGYQFEHSCSNLTDKVKTMREKGEEIDTFLFK
jgi:hypothetical protein